MQDLIHLTQAKNYREFIEKVLKYKFATKSFNGYSLLAKRAGFSSRSFPRDIINGKKNLTLSSMNKFRKAFKLPNELELLFEYLVKLEIQSCRTNNETTEELNLAIKNLKSRIVKNDVLLKKENIEKIYRNKELPKVYAALSTTNEAGVKLDTILLRTALEKENVLKTLLFLQEMKLVKKKGNYYLAIENHPNLQHIKTSKSFNYYISEEISGIQKKIEQNNLDSHSLLFNSCFTISQKNANDFKESLRKLLLKYVDEKDDPKGDKVVSLTCFLN